MQTRRFHRSLLVLAIFSCSALAGCPSPPSEPGGGDAGPARADTGSPDVDGGAGDDGGSTGTDAAVPTDLCPTYDVNDPAQVTFGRASSGPAVIDADTTWTADHVYFVIGSLDIQGVSLTIEAGTLVCLDAGTGAPPTLDFRTGATFVVSGTAAAPVVLAPATADSSWNSITLEGGDAATLEHLHLIGGGAGGSGVLRVEDGFEGPLAATDVHVLAAAGMAVSLRNDGGLDASASVFVDSQDPAVPGPAVEATLLAAQTLDASTFRLGAGLPASTRVVRLVDGLVDVDITLRADLGVPFVAAGDIEVQRDDVSFPIPSLTLEAGVTLLFPAGSSLLVGSPSGLDADGGNLVLVGTASAPVVLGSAESATAAGDWGGVEIYADSFEPSVTRLENVRIEDAGGASNGSDILHCSTLPDPLDAGIRLYASISLPYEGPAIDAVEVVRSAGDGLAFTCLPSRCLTTDYAGRVTGSELAGELLRDRSCP